MSSQWTEEEWAMSEAYAELHRGEYEVTKVQPSLEQRIMDYNQRMMDMVIGAMRPKR